MRAYVFTDRALASQAGRFVWLELDTEDPRNAAIRKRLDIPALPTFFIVDPADERVALRWVGGATVAQLKRILDDGAMAVREPGLPPREGGADAAFARAERLYGAADWAAAAGAYEEALAHAPEGWAHYARSVESALFAYSSVDSNEKLARLAHDAYPRLARTSSSANVAGSGLDAALALPAGHPERAAWVDFFERGCRDILADPSIALAGDDRSAVYIALLDARHDAKDDAGARQVAGAWASFLEGEAARAKTPDARAVYDSHRLSAYLELGQPERAIPMLTASERDLPGDYNPPARLATAYRALKRWDDALAASDRAMARAYGPRKLLLYQVRSDVYVGRADSTAARRTLEEAVAYADALPPGQRSESTLAALRKRLAAFGQ